MLKAMNKVSSPDDHVKIIFLRYHRLATFLLLIMGCITLLGYYLTTYTGIKHNFWVELILAGSQAGFIGGCADWFAVTALFRHPMGLPIPHTAILPKQKKRLGYGLGWFIAQYIFTEKDITLILKKMDLPSFLGKYLDKTENIEYLSSILLKSLPDFLDRIEDGRISNLITKIINRLLSGESISPFIGRIIRTMLDIDQHQDIISFILEILKKTLKEKESSLREMIHSRVEEQGGRFLGWMIGDSIATKVLVAVNKEMDRIDPHNDAVREKIGQWIKDEIDKIENDPERVKNISEAFRQIVNHESIQEWRENLWKKIRKFIHDDARNEDGWFRNVIIDSIHYFSELLQKDPKIRKKINKAILKLISRSLPNFKEGLIRFTETAVSQWDSQALVDRLECRIGKDLQYIRINGSIVGFSIGIIFFLFVKLFFNP